MGQKNASVRKESQNSNFIWYGFKAKVLECKET